MPKVMIVISEERSKMISELWIATKEILSPDALHQLGWNDIGAFYLDLLIFGLDQVTKTPFDFIMQVREKKNPMFKDLDTIKRVVCGRSDDESLKAYA